MRTLLASLVTSGGLLAVVAFWLPWVAISCNDTTLGTVSPYDRAVGVEAAAEVQVHDTSVVVDEGLEPAPAYWLLLAVAVLLGVTGVAIGLGSRRNVMRLGVIALMTSGVGLYTAVGLGLGDKLGIAFPDALAPGIAVRLVLQPGVWIAVAGYSLGLSGSLATLLFGRRAG